MEGRDVVVEEGRCRRITNRSGNGVEILRWNSRKLETSDGRGEIVGGLFKEEAVFLPSLGLFPFFPFLFCFFGGGVVEQERSVFG